MAAATMTLVGTTLGQGRYQVKRKLGEGGMALVYLAHDQNVGVDVVVKVPKAAILADAEFARRFKHEIRSMVQLSHPHVVKIKDVGEHQGMPYYVMELLTAGSLEDRLAAQAEETGCPMSPASLADWLDAVAAALDFIHSQGVVHRDIKPANILFDRHGNAYVSDFGIAKAISGESAKKQTMMTQAGMVLGTGHYMAPEVSLGQDFDGRADQYSLAVTVYEVLGGRVPFAGTSLHAIIAQQSSGKIPPLHGIAPAVPKALSQVIEKGLQFEAKKRFPSCLAFARAVLAAVGIAGKAGGAASPALKMTCPACKNSFPLPANPEGKNVACPACGAKYAVAKKPMEKHLSETSRSVAPTDATHADRRVPAPANKKALYVLGGVTAGTFVLACAGVVVYLAGWMLGLDGTQTEPAKAQASPVKVAELAKEAPAKTQPDPVVKAPDPQPKVSPPINPAPPVQPIVPPVKTPPPPPKAPTLDLGTGVFLVQSMTRVTGWAAVGNKGNYYGYENGVSIMSAWVNPTKSAMFTTPLLENTDYKFVAAGDQDAQIMELEIIDDVTKMRVERDQTGRPEAIVTFRAPSTRKYTLKMTLVQSRENYPCMCSLVLLKRNGLSIPFSNLDDVTLSISRRVADLPKTQPGNKRYEYTRVPNQWAVFGGVLSPGADLSVNNINLGFGDRILLGACDKNANKLDLSLSRSKKVVASYQGAATPEPSLQKFCSGLGYELRLRNSSALPGPALVMMAVVDVTTNK